MKISFGYGNRTEDIEVPDKNLVGILRAERVESSNAEQNNTTNCHAADSNEEKEILEALRNPVGSKTLKEILSPGEKIAIVSSDITRPMPTYKVMPYLLDELYSAGIKPENITLVLGLGTHRGHTEEERRKLVGDRAYSEIKCMDSTPNDVVRLGHTSFGTPIDITRKVAEADRRICLGNIEYHYFAGYSGGAKAIMPGVSTAEAIQSNHRMMVDDESYAGNLDSNPVRQDIEEAAAVCGIDFILNVVLDESKHIIKAVAGDSIKAHREGCKFLDKIYLKKIPSEADIVIASQGGAPKDLNLYQVQKALDNARHAVKQGGVIILIGSCREGMGNKVFEEWMTKAKTPEEMVDRIAENFQLGGHKAAAIAITLEKADVYLVSDMEDEFVKSIFLTPMKTGQMALEKAFEKMGKDASVIAMPYGGSTLPKIG